MTVDKSLMGMHVVLVGNPVDGFMVFGPFKTGEEAIKWGFEDVDDDWCIAKLWSAEELRNIGRPRQRN